ncbi:aminopeptidase Q-like [Rhinoraja longicauda]
MRPKSTSGFYLSRKAVVICSLLILVLLVVCTVLAILYGKLIAEKTGISSPTREPPSTDWETPVPSRRGPWNNSRLPNSLIARNYQLELWPRPLSGLKHPSHFFGQVNLTATCSDETEVILLHSHELTYTGVAIGAGPLPSPAILCTWLAVENDYLVIELNGTLVAGQNYTIQANYSGKLADNPNGLFISDYQEWGVNKTVIASQLEPIHARSVFPCFDEPAMKATFDIRLVHDPQLVALSNMPAIDFSERLAENGTWKVTTFNTTLKMSTYLVALVISDYGCVNTTSNGVEIRVWAEKKAISDGEANYALKVLGPILSFFEEYFNVSYPLSKLDVVAVPMFDASAMENWGLLIFKSNVLLYNQRNDFIGELLLKTLIIAHELAHQWFGNLVTMYWWNDLWLNEGLASYFEFIGATVVIPSLRSVTIPFTDEFLYLDTVAKKEENIGTREEIDQMFNSVTYNKGAVLIAIASHVMTKELLAKGLRSYLKMFSYSNTVTDDMWDHLQMAIDSQDAIKLPAPVKSIMDTWAKQEGFPLVTVNTTSGIITQEHNLKKMENKTSNNSWFIPIFWMKSGSKQPIIWLEEKSKTFPEVKCTTDEDWILLNFNISAFCRVNYDDSNWHRLSRQLNKDPSVIPVVNRAQLISDAFDFARVEHVDIEIALGMIVYLAKEQDSLIWHTAMDQLKHIEFMLATTSSYGLYKKFIINRFVPFYQYQMKLIKHDFNNINNDTFKLSLLISTIQTACRLNLKDCLDQTTSLFSQFMNNPTVNTIPKPLREAVYCGALKAGTIIEWDFAFSIYTEHESDDNDLLRAMACSTEPWILTRYIRYAMDKSKIPEDHACEVFQHVANNPIGWLLVWNFIRANWKTFQIMRRDDYEWKSFFWTLINGFSSNFEFKEFELFLNNTAKDDEWPAILQQTNDILQKKLKWKEKNNLKIYKWLSRNVG